MRAAGAIERLLFLVLERMKKEQGALFAYGMDRRKARVKDYWEVFARELRRYAPGRNGKLYRGGWKFGFADDNYIVGRASKSMKSVTAGSLFPRMPAGTAV